MCGARLHGGAAVVDRHPAVLERDEVPHRPGARVVQRQAHPYEDTGGACWKRNGGAHARHAPLRDRVDLDRQHRRGHGDLPVVPADLRGAGRGKPPLAGSSDPHFRGDADRWNPEELLVAALSQCHLLAFLHAAATAAWSWSTTPTRPPATLATEGTGGRMTGVVLRPVVTVAEPEMAAKCAELHERRARRTASSPAR